MRRVLTVLALGLLWAVTARAQGEPVVDGDEHVSAEAFWGTLQGGFLSSEAAAPERTEEAKTFLAEILRDAPHLQPGAGKNVEASWLRQIVRSKRRLSWQILFPDDQDFQPWSGEVGWKFEDDRPAIAFLYELCLLDALSPLAVGPDMGPFVNEPEPEPTQDWIICIRGGV